MSEEEETGATADAETSDDSTVSAPTPDVYSTLRDAVDAGIVQLDNGVAKTCADLVADVYYDVSAIRSYVEREGSAAAPISNLPEGTVFSDKLAGVTASFLELCDGLMEKLSIRHDALIEAGKAFEEAENANAVDFGSLTEFTYFVPSDAPNALHGAGTYSSDSLFSDSVFVPEPAFAFEDSEGEEVAAAPIGAPYSSVLAPTMGNVLFDPLSLDPEVNAEYAWTMLYELGEHLRNNNIAGGLTDASRSWSQLGSALSGALQDLNTNIERATDGAWQGEAKDAAQALIKQDELDVASVGPATDAMRDLYAYLAYWMKETAEWMPTNPEVPMRQDVYGFLPVGPIPVGWVHIEPTSEVNTELIEDRLVDMATFYTAPISYADQAIPDLADLVDLMTPLPGDSSPLPTDTDTEIDEDTNTNTNTYSGTEGTGDNGGRLSISEGQYPESLTATGYSPDGMPIADTELWEQQAQQEATGQQLAQMIPQALSQAMNAVPQALEGLRGLQEGLTDTGLPAGIPPGGLPLGMDPSKAAGLPALKTGGPGGSLAGGSSPSSSAPKGPADVEKLFPRASLSASDSPLAGALGSFTGDNLGGANPAGSPMGGAPMGGGAPGGGRGGQGDDKHERAKYLDRADNLDEALGDPPDMTRPVIGDLPSRPVAPEPGRSPQQPVQHQRPAPQEPARPVRPEQPVVLPRQERG